MAILSEVRYRRTAIVSNDATISSKIKNAQEKLQEHLNASKPKTTGGRWPTWLVPYDPVRMKNLQKINGYLVRMLHFKLDPDPKVSDSNARVQPLTSLLQQIEKSATLSSDAVWEVADALEMELVEHGGKRLRRRVWEDVGEGILICTEEEYQRAIREQNEANSSAFPKEDVIEC